MNKATEPMREDAAAKGSIVYTSITSPLGELWLAATERGISQLSFGMTEADWLAMLAGEDFLAPSRDDGRFLEARRQIAEYFGGRRRSFALPLDLSRGTSFQRRVWERARRIPYGQVRSYAQVARDIGAPRASRAVGQALGANPVPIIVPCHRVLRADGSLGGYSAGLEIKRALLSLEGYL